MELFSRWWYYYTEFLSYGLTVTLRVFAVGIVCILVWGLVVAVMRTSKIKPLRFLALAYIEFFRSTPFLVQLLAIFAALPIFLGVFLSPFLTALVALTLNSGGYMAEGYRSGLESVPIGQREAAAGLGMSSMQAFRRVILPQAFRIFLPAIGNTMAATLLSTPFVFLVGLEDLMSRANYIQETTSDFSVYLLVVIIYSVIGLMIVLGTSWLERHLRIAG